MRFFTSSSSNVCNARCCKEGRFIKYNITRRAIQLSQFVNQLRTGWFCLTGRIRAVGCRPLVYTIALRHVEEFWEPLCYGITVSTQCSDSELQHCCCCHVTHISKTKVKQCIELKMYISKRVWVDFDRTGRCGIKVVDNARRVLRWHTENMFISTNLVMSSAGCCRWSSHHDFVPLETVTSQCSKFCNKACCKGLLESGYLLISMRWLVRMLMSQLICDMNWRIAGSHSVLDKSQ